MSNLFQIKSISQLHKIIGQKPPKHPSISFIKFSDMAFSSQMNFEGASTDFYIISLKMSSGKLKYGRQNYDFEEGTLTFSAPNQVLYPSHLISDVYNDDGWSLFFSPDLLHGTDLGQKIDQYKFFSYDVNEALHISDIEKQKLLECVLNIVDEYSQNIDQHTQGLIASNLELLLNYCKRFYDRQFFTRKPQNSNIINKIESLLQAYFESDSPMLEGLPTVKYCAEKVHLSPNYLSDLLRIETGKTTKEHIDYFLIKKAKHLLLKRELSVSEIAYELGFEHPKSFSKLFKKRTGFSPSEFKMN
ncbi:MAG: helix-turn-helix domain-containing protein [Flavobacteriales bacterium]